MKARTWNKAAKVILSLIIIVGLLGIFKFVTRWKSDRSWANTVIAESYDLRIRLSRFHDQNGEFPLTLKSVIGRSTKPTDFLSRNQTSPAKSRWHYDRIDSDDYQIFVCGNSWVLYHDAVVYRHRDRFTDHWCSSLKKSHYLPLGQWRYIRGFSVFTERFCFDHDGKLQQHY